MREGRSARQGTDRFPSAPAGVFASPPSPAGFGHFRVLGSGFSVDQRRESAAVALTLPRQHVAVSNRDQARSSLLFNVLWGLYPLWVHGPWFVPAPGTWPGALRI